MLCFEVHYNGKRLCTAGVHDFGVLMASVSWVSHSPEQLARWTAQGVPQTDPVEMRLDVSGLTSGETEPGEHLKWVDATLSAGDEVSIRLIDASEADPPKERKESVVRVDEKDLSEVQKFLLMAAFYEGARPGSRFHKCQRVIRNALTMAGKEDFIPYHLFNEVTPDVEAYYGVLVEMIRYPQNTRLFEGQGNFGTEDGDSPADPPFTKCRLTGAGEEVAGRLLEKQDEEQAD
jgi:hypothetical protein